MNGQASLNHPNQSDGTGTTIVSISKRTFKDETVISSRATYKTPSPIRMHRMILLFLSI